MTKKQAIDLINQATAMLQLTRQDHEKIIEALKIIAENIEEEKK